MDGPAVVLDLVCQMWLSEFLGEACLDFLKLEGGNPPRPTPPHTPRQSPSPSVMELITLMDMLPLGASKGTNVGCLFAFVTCRKR